MVNTAKPDNTPESEFPTVQTSEWGDLSPHKLAFIRLCDKEGNISNSSVVEALVTDADMSVASNYQTPFDNINPEMKRPTLLGMLQSGEMAKALPQAAEGKGVIGSIFATAGKIGASITTELGISKNFSDAIQSLEGRSNLTKINSVQVFVSTSSVEMSMTLFFCALYDARKEVEQQIKLLQQWALPQLLAESIIKSVSDGFLQGIFPSIVPPFVAITYGGKTYKPFLIREVGTPLVTPMDKDGNRLSTTVTLSLISRRAWDAADIKTLYEPKNRRVGQ